MSSMFENCEDHINISKEFVENLLKKKVQWFKVNKGSNPGDNFTSILFAIEVKVEGESEPVHLLLKTYPALESRQKFLNETNLFLKEVKVYKEFIPDLVEFQRDKAPHEVIRPAVPPFIAGAAVDFSKENLDEVKMMSPFDNYLVMVDIRKTCGFQMVEKHVGLDYKHAALAVAELAKLHALGWAMKQKKNLKSLLSEYPYLSEMVFSPSNSSIDGMLMSNLELVQDIAKKRFQPDSAELRGIERLKNTGPMNVLLWFLPPDGAVQEKIIRNYLGGEDTIDEGEDDEPWLVSCHGDSWVNNMLFRYNDLADLASPTEMIFVDLQLYREGCPTTDLAYMFYCSTTYETREKHLGSLLKLYHEHFSNFCIALGVRPLKNFTFNNFLRRFNRAKLFGFLMSSMILPIILSKNSGKDLDAVATTGDNSQDSNSNSLSNVMKTLTENSGNDADLANRFSDIITEMIKSNIF